MVHEMKSFRKPMALVLSFLVAFTCSAALFRTSSRAATYGDLETDGWEIDENGKLTVITQEAMNSHRWSEKDYINPDTQLYDSLWWTTYSVEIGGDITTVQNAAFRGFKLIESVMFSCNDVARIEDSAFENCTDLETISFPSSLEYIGFSTFAGSGLTSVTIPSNVVTVGVNAFVDCSSLTTVTIASGQTNFMYQDGPKLDTLNFGGSKSQHAYQISSVEGFIGEGTTVNYGAFDVEFNYNYSGCPVSSWQTVSKNATATKPDDPVRENYSFEGWYLESSCTNQFDFTSEITSDITLYAKWVKSSNTVLTGYSLTLDGDIGVNFHISLTDAIKSDSKAKLVFSRTVGDKVIVEERMINDYIDTDPERDCFIYKINISPAEMTCPITITLVDGSQTEYQLGVFKAQAYAKRLVDEFGYERKLCIALLNYGTYCQLRFGINTSDLANSCIPGYDSVAETEVEDVTPVSITGDLSTVEYYGSSLDLRSNTDAYLYFSYEGSLDSISATVDGEAVDVVANKTSGYFNIRIPAIRANLLVYGFTVVITRGGESLTVVYNPLIYCDGVANGTTASEESLVNLVKALYLYADAADRYFN